MRYMKTISSAEFRKTYPRLNEPVDVTALGRVIGHYVPISTAISDLFVAGLRPGEPTVYEGRPITVATNDLDGTGWHYPKPGTAKTQQASRDAILRKINRPK